MSRRGGGFLFGVVCGAAGYYAVEHVILKGKKGSQHKKTIEDSKNKVVKASKDAMDKVMEAPKEVSKKVAEATKEVKKEAEAVIKDIKDSTKK